ncbi:MAG: hypothetical protein A2Y15_07145 [Clostridiales bacterium GWF2_36_10]|nr:MAG: hypothetical protein A2Y15_07145 [Clostridiales bacterium GWF2_36_10]HAN21339.1 hypothetical protein [Clostridiales bacterium]
MKAKATKFISFLLMFIFVFSVLIGCENGKTGEESTNSITDNSTAIKEKIDKLYVSELNRNKELVCINTGNTYTTTGDADDNGSVKLTDGVYAAEESTDTGWATFNYSSVIEINVKLDGVTEGINYFSLNMLQVIKNSIYSADEVKVFASLDGVEYVEIGLMIRTITESNLKLYELTLSGGIKAAYIRYTVKSEKSGKAYIDEVGVYAYGEKDKTNEMELITYDTKYDGKLPEEVTTPVYWDKSDEDYDTVKNLILGRTPSVFTMNLSIDLDVSTSPASDIYKLTDGEYTQSAKYTDPALFWSASAVSNTDGRLFIFDLEKTSAITGFRTNFVVASYAGVSLPDSYVVYSSENGKTWDVIYRRDGIRGENTLNDTIVSVKDDFDKAYRARFVAVFFDVEGHTRFDEIEIYGTKSTEQASPVSEKGNTKFFGGKFPVPEDVNGIKDTLLMYHSYAGTLETPGQVLSFNEEQCMTWLAYYDRDGNIKDTYFDTFIFLGGGQTVEWNKADMWKKYNDNLFADSVNLSALNSAAAKVGEALGKDDFKAKVMLTLFLPSKEFTEFGDIDGDGKNEDLSTLEGKKKVMAWHIDEYISRFNGANYTNLELVGFYWHDEVIRYDDVSLPAAIRFCADKTHESGDYIIMSCPYYLASGYYDWYNLGFDLAFNQPAYYFWNNNETAIPKTSTIAKALGYGVEMEVEGDAVTDINCLNKYIGYLKGGVDYGYMNAVHMYYYSQPYYTSCKSTSILGRQLYELNYRFVKGTLSFETSEAVYDDVFAVAPGEALSERLELDGISYKLSSSTKYGTLKLAKDGRFSYKPFDGFTGEDSFFIEVMVSGAETVIYEIKVNVG